MRNMSVHEISVLNIRAEETPVSWQVWPVCFLVCNKALLLKRDGVFQTCLGSDFLENTDASYSCSGFI